MELRLIALVPDVLAGLVQLPEQRTEIVLQYPANVQLRGRVRLQVVTLLGVDAVGVGERDNRRLGASAA